jgi:hypothetical protein
MAYHLVHRLADGRRDIASYETREKAEAHRSALIAKDPRCADFLFILHDEDEDSAGEKD